MNVWWPNKLFWHAKPVAAIHISKCSVVVSKISNGVFVLLLKQFIWFTYPNVLWLSANGITWTTFWSVFIGERAGVFSERRRSNCTCCVWTLTLFWPWISSPNLSSTISVCMDRSLLIVRRITFKLATWWPYWIFQFPVSNFSLALNIRSKRGT